MRHTLLALTAILTALGGSAGNDIRSLWTRMPDTAAVYIDSLTRRDMLYNYDNSIGFASANFFGGNSWIDTIAGNYMSIKPSDAMEMQMRVLPKADSTQVICVVKTYKPADASAADAKEAIADADAGESDVAFFDTQWQPLGGTFGLPLSTDEDSLLSQLTYCPDTMTRKRYAELKAMIDPVMLIARLSADDETLTLTLGTPMLTREERDDVKTIILSRKFKWNGITFK